MSGRRYAGRILYDYSTDVGLSDVDETGKLCLIFNSPSFGGLR